MKIAVFSDVHANLPALEAFFKDLDSREVDAVYCLGDLVGYNVWPNEVIAEIRKRKIPTIAGNHDLKVKKLKRDEGLEVDYAYHIGSDSAREYLRTLPRFLRLQYEFGSEKVNFLFVHGSYRRIDEYLLEDLEETYVLDVLQEADAGIIFCGHTHKPYHRILQTPDSFKHIINVGAIGKPKDGNPKGCYVILSLHNNSTLQKSDGIEVEFVRCDYDVEKAAKAVEDSLLPNEFAERLRRAF